MPIKYDRRGFDKLTKNLKKLSKPQNIPLADILPDRFIQKHSKFNTLQELFDAAGYEKEEDVESEQFLSFIKENTDFNNWQEMINAGGELWAKKQLLK